MQVSVAAKRVGDGEGPLRPGEEIEVAVSAVDSQGRPAAAEFSVSLIEQALTERHPSSLAPIDAFFRGARRVHAMRTQSSATFRYQPQTQNVSDRLLTEKVRRGSRNRGRQGLGLTAAMGGAGNSGFGGGQGGGFGGGGGSFGGGGGGGGGFFGGSSGDRSSGSRNGGGRTSGRSGVYPVVDLVMPIDSTDGVFAGNLSLVGGTTRARNKGPRAKAKAAALPPTDDASARWSPTADGLTRLIDERRGSVQAVFADGRAQVLNLRAFADGWNNKKAKRVAKQLREQGVTLLPALGPQETGYWNPVLATDAKGKATVTFPLPDRSTGWKLTAKGITAGAIAGQAETELTVSKDLFGDLKIPAAFTQGDKAIIKAVIHNRAIQKGEIEVTLKTTIGRKSVEQKQTVNAAGEGLVSVLFRADLATPEGKDAPRGSESRVVFELTVAAGKRRDTVRKSVPLRPLGIPIFATASGVASSDAIAWVEPPKTMPMQAPKLEIIVGPSVNRGLLDSVLAPATSRLSLLNGFSGTDSTASTLMASVSLQKMLKSSAPNDPRLAELDVVIRSALSGLISSRQENGGWTWNGASCRTGADVNATARALWALKLTQDAGYEVPDDAIHLATAFLRAAISKTDNTDNETKVILLHALAVAGEGSFTLANRLYRNRQSLTNSGLALLALGFAEMDRDAIATELLELLSRRDWNADRPAGASATSSPTEVRALLAVGLMMTQSKSPAAKQAVEWLMSRRQGSRWTPDAATGPAVLALSQWQAASGHEQERYRLTVFVNDKQVAVLEIEEDTETQTIQVPAEMLNNAKRSGAKERVDFQIEGRGRFAYQCVLGGFVPADKLVSTAEHWQVRRHYTPAPPEVDGQPISSRGGLLIGVDGKPYRNPVTQLPVGRRAQVELIASRGRRPEGTRNEYLILTDPIPSGTAVIADSIKGSFDRHEISPGSITFYLGSSSSGSIRYDLHGYAAGDYAAGPAVVRDAYRPDRIAVSEIKTLRVLPQGAKSADPYRLSAEERYALGKRAFDRKEYAEARKHLSELFGKGKLPEKTQRAVAEMLMTLHMEIGPPKEAVRYFELVIEKWPQIKIGHRASLQVGKASHEIGEYERGYLVFRAVVQSNFMLESAAAGYLETEGEFLRSARTMERLLREYPPESYLSSAEYALAQRVYAKSSSAAGDAKLRQAKVRRLDLVALAGKMLDNFLTSHPADPAADQAAYSTIAARLDLKKHEEAVAACERIIKRYPDSEYLDSFWYALAYCRFALGQHQEALLASRKVAEEKRVDKQTGRLVDAANKWQAVYIRGQVYHSLGEAAKAIAEYDQVKDRFADADQAIDFFTRKNISLPEATTIKPGQPVEIPLSFRNVPACEVKVYRIDLMKFALLNSSLDEISNINLAGIEPFHEASVPLGDGKDYRDREKKLSLPLKEEGAYLIVCRGGDLHASGLALVSPLAVQVQEDALSGRVRITVKDAAKDKYVSDVHVKVIGSFNKEFVAGDTDLRGVFVADQIQGRSTIIAQVGDSRYAFFRGDVAVGVGNSGAVFGGGGGGGSRSGRRGYRKVDLLDRFMGRGAFGGGGNSGFGAGQSEKLRGIYQGKGAFGGGGVGGGGFF
ncbi:MAG: tetratricopeptide repeat protein [Planctomycetales bacterium]